MAMKNSTVIGINTKLDYKFFRYWIEFFTPLHKLEKRDADILASLLFERYKLTKSISDPKVLPIVLNSSEIRKTICENVEITANRYNVFLTNMRAKKIIVDGDINQKLIPRFQDNDESEYNLIIHFDINES